jgi:hypothetical protein
MSSFDKYLPSRKVSDLLNYGKYGSSPQIIASGGAITQSNGFTIHTFSSTGIDQNFTIFAANNATIEIFMWGAAGGGSNAEGYSDPGGPGGFAYGLVNLSSPLNYIVQVGSGGGRGSTSRPTRAYPNAGLPSLRNGYTSGGGGGRSAIFSSSVNSQNAIVIAGGGGGASGHGGGAPWAARSCSGGGGGGTSGGFGRDPYDGAETDNGGTQSTGGSTSSGSGNGGPAQLRGSDAGNGTLWDNGGWNAAGGGGDGWYGGGSINSRHQGGGGGSGYLSNLVFSGSLESTLVPDSRVSSLLPPQTSNSFYQSGIGSCSANANGGNGLVVIRYRAL